MIYVQPREWEVASYKEIFRDPSMGGGVKEAESEGEETRETTWEPGRCDKKEELGPVKSEGREAEVDPGEST
ncbi:hypothetical protein NDU88_001924 [Pleurodeles waltl]|uniref:Uncharacterized protein n=1 Tax=Pleurodeles waltl TaxID=8319 RepID=A0AAV7W0C0_PLEWA|nr:hypothetical protein NDU88_001924 [Pleurodeles waltl]